MTRLDCTVTSCLYNKERCCCKDNIEVEGDHARHSRDTCCVSFRDATNMHGKIGELDVKKSPKFCANRIRQQRKMTFSKFFVAIYLGI